MGGVVVRGEEEILKDWIDTLDTADRALRLEGAAHEHRQNLQAMKKYFSRIIINQEVK